MHNSLDSHEAVWYESMFRAAFKASRGDDFETLFIDLMGAKHGESFGVVDPHGSDGDFGCDGLLRSKETIYQCWGPASPTDAKMKQKMTKNLERAKEKWPWMTTWCFVMNQEGPSPKCIQHAESLATAHGVEVKIWCYRDLKAVLDELPEHRLRTIIDPYPNPANMGALPRAAMDAVIDALEVEATSEDPYVTPRPEKMDYNRVGNSWREHLKSGMPAHDIVQASLDSSRNPNAGEAIVARIHAKYKEFHDAKPEADWALEQLFDWLLQNAGKSAGASRAVFALISYCFEFCKVLEPVPEATT